MGEGVAILGIHDGVIELVQVPAKHVRNARCAHDLHDRPQRRAESDEGSAVNVVGRPVVDEIDGQNDCNE